MAFTYNVGRAVIIEYCISSCKVVPALIYFVKIITKKVSLLLPIYIKFLP